ncbi:hypothetical protein QCD85_01400 [Paenibacillus sp. PsM32]|uniref:Uncharacterized protein n=1 Tax=Paenibacillus nicotianae TaxID=1526551 RepID=A0ABW4UX06_9BACL|nr:MULTISPECIES: hypothetical protein [unclassified Paenibacillus]MDN4616734.1 hypothetical protein [Paenibacillus sp. PsM32]WDF49485.1 hypothetical protein PQ460_15890 [Paenibacillus sp. KACC 21273]
MRTITYKHSKADGLLGYELLPARYGEKWDQIQADSVFIYAGDFDYLIPYLKKHYPIVDPVTNDRYGYFDTSGFNPIAKALWTNILAEMKAYQTKDRELKAFIRSLVTWLEIQLEWADEIIIFGNL